ncbi:hypothetical protein LWI29_035892 [Acer saccharum]|uniref:30S ribosomal protein 3, chloroplastic n=1 Tax=Acer saccharum TaxID=4024 RepID=A0AA39VGP5_ACESA|nr:hypothetical protein LWI29_017822 [Acer saccharum]KAK0585893.1 hypothetical protein LWI29_035892 [Acer saccharum]
MSSKFNLNAALKPTTTTKLPSQNLLLIRNSIVFKPETCCLTRRLKLSSSILDQEPAVDNSDFDIQPRKQKLGVVVKPNEKPRVVLKFIWMQNDIGIALDQMIPGHGTIPLSPYYFWPRKDAWEELKVLLESKPWISQIERIHLLNQATDIINLWQTAGGNLL